MYIGSDLALCIVNFSTNQDRRPGYHWNVPGGKVRYIWVVKKCNALESGYTQVDNANHKHLGSSHLGVGIDAIIKMTVTKTLLDAEYELVWGELDGWERNKKY